MVNKKRIKIFGLVIFVLILIGIFLFLYLRSDEDYWMQDSRGVWIKHGEPAKIPEYVWAQQKLVVCTLNLYSQFSNEDLSSQCLGSCDGYAVDIVHVPRTEEDDEESNMCEAFVRGQLRNFIELDKEGNIVRIV